MLMRPEARMATRPQRTSASTRAAGVAILQERLDSTSMPAGCPALLLAQIAQKKPRIFASMGSTCSGMPLA